MRTYLKQPLVISTLVAIFCGMLTLAQPLDQGYWNTRYRFGQTQAMQSIVLVTMDAETSGSDRDTSRLLRTIARQKPEHIYLDKRLTDADADLQAALDGIGKDLSLVVRFSKPDSFEADNITLPATRIIPSSRILVSGWMTNFWRYADNTALAVQIGDSNYSTLGARISGRSGPPGDTVRPDFTVDPSSVSKLTAYDILSGRFRGEALNGKHVIVKEVRSSPPVIGYFSHGRIDPVFLDIAVVKSLRNGGIWSVDWFPPIVAFYLLVFAAREIRRRRMRYVAYSVACVTVLAGPALLETIGVSCNPSASIVGLVSYAAIKIWSKWRIRVLQTSRSGLPNFVALTGNSLPSQHDVVVTVIGRYEEILATLPGELHGECARQIARRLAVGSGARDIYHGEGGLFAWVEPTRPLDQQVENLEGSGRFSPHRCSSASMCSTRTSISDWSVTMSSTR